MPTLFLMECVMMYMPGKDTDALLTYITEKFSQCHIINYDVVGL